MEPDLAPTGQIRRGVWLAGLAALLFGMTAPLLKRASAGLGPLASGSLLYLGAALGALSMAAVRTRRGGRLGLPRGSLGRLALVAAVGGAVAPALLVMGLKRIDAASGSLLLALEAPFTLVLARLVLGERIGARVAVAALLITLGGAALVGASLSLGSSLGAAGGALVAAAALAWAVDNLLSRALAEHDPLAVVAAKGLLGGAASAAAALVLGERLPRLGEALPLLALGAVGYGFSLQLYLGAQRTVGAARTASVFAVAPLIGVLLALILGDAWPGWQLPVAMLLVGLGLWLHASERHRHRHHHDPIEHEHLHRHDDGHHDHRHDPMPSGPHSHPHRHEAATHEHEHGEDLHHRHVHPPPHPHDDGSPGR
jgi:drug/metabolite transporter (DMT)-like permease